MNSKNLVEIKESDIQKHYKNTYQTLTGFSHSAASSIGRSSGNDHLGTPRRRSVALGSSVGSTSTPQRVELLTTVRNVCEDNPMQTDKEHSVLSAVHRGLAIASEVVEEFGKMTGLARMHEDNARGRLESSERSRMNDLNRTAAFIAVQTLSNFVIHKLGASAPTDSIEANELDSLRLEAPLKTIESVIAAFDNNVQTLVHNDEELITIAVSFFNKVLDDLATQQSSLSGTEAFSEVTFEVKQDEFEVHGFERARPAKSTKLIMTFKEPHEVIGNSIAKYQAQKLAKMLMCYDFSRQMNPFAELGGFIYTFMGDGNPGTGKTTLIQMMAGQLHKYCEIANYPFYYENFGPDSISSYQGQSAQNAKQFIRNVMNPGVIGFGTIDDIDQVAGKRGDKQSSSGQQEVTAVLMESFAGANTRVLGNCTYGMFSNYPENVDDALRQRAGGRFLIDGPQTYEDFVDILALLIGKNHKVSQGDIDLFVTQEIKKAVKAGYEKHSLPQEEKLLDVYESTVRQEGELTTLASIGRYLKNIQEAEPRFTGRAIKNITDAAKVRSMDFDMPDEWFENPELFLFKDYDTKKQMIEEFIDPITPTMLLQEINRYADSEFRYANKSFDAAVESRVKEMQVGLAAQEKIQGV